MIRISVIDKANDLPEQWDKLAEDYFQQRCFLAHTEQFNPCNQRYYLYYVDDNLFAAASVYTLQIDLFAFSGLKSPVKMQVTGIPCSVSSQGVFGDKMAVELLKEHIRKSEKGFLLFLNLRQKTTSDMVATGQTFPTFVIRRAFSDWNDYLNALRSGYKRRINKINEPDAGIHFERMLCRDFSPEMYQLYLNVYKRSEGKLEKLSPEFFVNLPSEFLLTVCKKEDKVIGWNIGLYHQGVYYFFLGGIDYEYNRIHQTYLKLLSGLVKDGIEKGAKYIELGQTAGIAKMRMGGMPAELYMEACHSVKLINLIIKKAGSLLEYRQKTENTNAFKSQIL